MLKKKFPCPKDLAPEKTVVVLSLWLLSVNRWIFLGGDAPSVFITPWSDQIGKLPKVQTYSHDSN
jgi:hypothetical protein